MARRRVPGLPGTPQLILVLTSLAPAGAEFAMISSNAFDVLVMAANPGLERLALVRGHGHSVMGD
jgi:hypothetical protein